MSHQVTSQLDMTPFTRKGDGAILRKKLVKHVQAACKTMKGTKAIVRNLPYGGLQIDLVVNVRK
jgi:hypothetical protein